MLCLLSPGEDRETPSVQFVGWVEIGQNSVSFVPSAWLYVDNEQFFC